MAAKKNKPLPKGTGKVEKVMKEYKAGELNIGKSKKKVTSKKQAVAIAYAVKREAEHKRKPKGKK